MATVEDSSEKKSGKVSRPMVEDLIVIWFDPSMEEMENQGDVQKTKSLLRQINCYVVFFANAKLCWDYIRSISKEKLILITSGSYAIVHLDELEKLTQVDSIFIFCVQLNKYLPLKEKYPKVTGVFTEQADLLASLMSTIESVTTRATVFSIFDGKQRPAKYLTRESASFLWFQLLTDVLRKMAQADMNERGIEEMLKYCELYYRDNEVELKLIENFRKNYKPTDAIVWYSEQSFIYRLVNRALRTEDIHVLYTFRAYITDLRNCIAREHERTRQSSNKKKSHFVRLYRGLKMNQEEIDQMRENAGCLVSMNGFLSTSRNIEQAIPFATKPSQRPSVVGVLLEIEGNIHSDQMIFADIAQYSVYPSEQEVLFDLATVLKIVHVEFDQGKRLWTIHLTDIEKSSCEVSDYIKSMAMEFDENNSTLLIGRLMCDMGEYNKSKSYFKSLLLSLPQNHPDVANIHFHLGRVSYFLGDYRRALEQYEQALNLQKLEILPKKYSFDLARTLHNIGNIYLYQKQNSKALEYYQEALEMKRAVLVDNPNHPSIATTLTAIGSIYKQRGNLEKALELYEQSYNMKKVSLPLDHPSIADSLNNLGTIYEERDEYEKALDCYRQSLIIKKKTLPETHPSIGVTLNNMGIIYRKEGDYHQALLCYNRSLEIERMSLSSDSLDIADTYNNLCVLYRDQSQYDKALDMAHLKLNILRKHFHEDDAEIKYAKDVIHELNAEMQLEPSDKAADDSFLETSF